MACLYVKPYVRAQKGLCSKNVTVNYYYYLEKVVHRRLYETSDFEGYWNSFHRRVGELSYFSISSSSNPVSLGWPAAIHLISSTFSSQAGLLVYQDGPSLRPCKILLQLN